MLAAEGSVETVALQEIKWFRSAVYWRQGSLGRGERGDDPRYWPRHIIVDSSRREVEDREFETAVCTLTNE